MKKPCNCLPPPPRPQKGPSEYIPSKTYPDPLVGAPGYIPMHHGRGPCGCGPFIQVPDPNIRPPRPEPVPPEPSPECNCPPKIYRSRVVEVVAGDNIKVDTKDTSDGTEFTVHAPEFNGADAKHDGTSGTVPAPKAGDENRVLTGGGVWADIEIPEQVQADWAEENEEDPAFIHNKPELADVATSGSYNDLTDKPEIPEQVQSDWAQENEQDPSFIKNKPELADVATSGSYNDLEDKPEIPEQVQSDWAQEDENDPSFIQNKPELADVATSGSYNDLDDKPEIPEQVQSDWSQEDEHDPSFIQNKPELADVATSGSYNDLEDKPDIPAAQVQTDWNQADDTQPDFLKNKPGNFQGATENANGAAGFVPAPTMADRDKFLCGNGTWANVDNTRGCTVAEMDAWIDAVDNEGNNNG